VWSAPEAFLADDTSSDRVGRTVALILLARSRTDGRRLLFSHDPATGRGLAIMNVCHTVYRGEALRLPIQAWVRDVPDAPLPVLAPGADAIHLFMSLSRVSTSNERASLMARISGLRARLAGVWVLCPDQ
jgi:hypothetical protein